MTRSPKKSDSIEIRLPHQAKRAFMERCRAEGRTASDVIRGFVDAKIADAHAAKAGPGVGRFLRSAATAVTIGALALAAPTPISAAPNFEPPFAAFDRNHDGLLTPAEFGASPTPSTPCAGKQPVMALPLRQSGIPPAPGMRPFAMSTADSDFAAADVDKDGTINFAEYVADQLRILHAGFDALDTNHDGRLRIREYVAAYAIEFRGAEPNIAPFQELDRDGDGNVAWSEFLA